MKKQLLFAFGISVSVLAIGQIQYDVEIPTPDGGSVMMIKPKNFSVTRPIRDLDALYEAVEKSEAEQLAEAQAKEPSNKRERRTHAMTNPNALPQGDDPLAASSYNPIHTAAPPIANWQAQSGSGYPPDPSGAAGPNHYVQAVNTTYRVYNKTGTGLTGTLNLSSMWSGSTNDGDPIVLYDRYADRWIISQFQISGNEILIAVSQTNDPTGSYYTWTFVPQASQFPDYFKLSIWHDGYYMTANWNERVVAFDRTAMLAGNASPSMMVKAMSTTPTNGFFAPMPADADGQLPPSGTPALFFSFEDDGWSSSNQDAIRIYQMNTNWSNPPSTTCTLVTALLTTPFNAVFTTSWTDVPQPGTSQKLDVISGVVQFRAQYRRWSGYNSVLVCLPVKVTGLQAGIRWLELRENTANSTWSIYQEGTYAPTTDYYWMGGLAMDDQGNIGMGYNKSNATSTYPGLYYTGRLAADPLGQMTVAEQTAIAGGGSQSGIERWGDYAQCTLDPDGVTFWYTGEYYASGPAKRTRIFSFQIATSIGMAENQNAANNLTVYQNGSNLQVNASNLVNNDEMLVDLFDVSGKLISGQKLVPVANMLSTTISVDGLAKGVYMVRVGNIGFQKVVKVSVN
ncbi:MAG: hypothetical protein FD123_1490 [Bacteroidetes bacterium]|nr:MAG: hypothetical protein FD123_1490 [Bacteroidota bacterium]